MRIMRRMLALGLCFALTCMPVRADEDTVPVWITKTEAGENTEELLWEDSSLWQATDTAVSTPAEALEIGGKSAVLMDLGSGSLLYEKNIHERMPIASVTKIMTLLLVMEAIEDGHLQYTDTLTCSETAASMGGSQIWLEVGETMTVDDLLKAVAVVSANDACAVFAEHLSGSIESFVVQMNARAAELGMENTHFLDCSGLNDEAYSSAYDVALMSRELMKHQDIVRYTTIWMDTLRGGASQLVNTNKLVRHYNGATGLKTGTTSTAGHNLSATATRDGLSLVAVILGCKTTDERFGGTRKLLDYGFANYTTTHPSVNTADIKDATVLHGTETKVTARLPDMEPLLLHRNEAEQVKCVITQQEAVEAPVKQGQKIGEIQVMVGDKTVATYPLCAAKAVDKMTVGAAFGRLFSLLAATGT